MDGFWGVVLFATVAALGTALLVLALAGGLVLAWRQRRDQARRARARGWRLWAGEYHGQVAGTPWSGRISGDEERGEYHVEFVAGIEGGPGQGFALEVEPDGNTTAWTQGHVRLGTAVPWWWHGEAWAALPTPDVLQAWQRARGDTLGALAARYQHHFVTVALRLRHQQPTVDQQEAVMALGEALLARTHQLLREPPATTARAA
jgi:hypothetical protein